MSDARLSIDQLNALDQDSFVQHLGFLFERSPWIAAEAWHARPFASRSQLHESLCAVMYAASRDQQIALIRAHPDLAGKAAIAGDLTPDSLREQASAGLDRLAPDEFAAFTRLNNAYRDRFGFPFVVCVREHTKESILAAFARRLEHDRESEIATALGEIAKIAKLRLDSILHA